MDFQAARVNMVEGQIKPNKVTDKRLIDVLHSLQREDFLPNALKERAYSDECLEIVQGRFMLSPMLLARLVQIADIQKTDVVLDIGCLTGYSTALMAHFAEMVIGLVEDDKIVAIAEESLQHEDYCNTVVCLGVLKEGLLKQSPYDVIFVNGAVSQVPTAWFDQLKEGGRLVCVEKPHAVRSRSQAVLYVKKNGEISKQVLFDAEASYIPGCQPENNFSF